MIDACLRNHSGKQITLPKVDCCEEGSQQSTLFKLSWHVEANRGMGWLIRKPLWRKGRLKVKKELLDKIDLTGLGEWSKNEQKEAQELITEYAGIFAMSDIDLGKTSLVKHSIRLTDNILV